jgi:hypothetical protein
LVSGVIDTGDKLVGGFIDTVDKLVSGVLFDIKQKYVIGVMGTGDRGSAVFIEEPATNLSVINILEKVVSNVMDSGEKFFCPFICMV